MEEMVGEVKMQIEEEKEEKTPEEEVAETEEGRSCGKEGMSPNPS